MCADKFVDISAEHEIADLTISLYTLALVPVQGVPEANASIGCSSTTRQQAFLVRAPCQGLNCGSVAQEPPCWFRISLGMSRPNEKFVIITARCQLHIIMAPPEATHFLLVPIELYNAICAASQIMIVN